MFRFTDAQRARTMRRRKIAEPIILGFFKDKYTTAEIDGLLTELRTRNAKYRKDNYSQNTWAHLMVSETTNIAPPQAVLTEREQRLMLWPRTLTAALMGDPLPGESALDRR